MKKIKDLLSNNVDYQVFVDATFKVLGIIILIGIFAGLVKCNTFTPFDYAVPKIVAILYCALAIFLAIYEVLENNLIAKVKILMASYHYPLTLLLASTWLAGLIATPSIYQMIDIAETQNTGFSSFILIIMTFPILRFLLFFRQSASR